MLRILVITVYENFDSNSYFIIKREMYGTRDGQFGVHYHSHDVCMQISEDTKLQYIKNHDDKYSNSMRSTTYVGPYHHGYQVTCKW